MKEENNTLALYELMKKRKITQTSLARHLGVKQGTVSNWKTGRTPLPSSYVLDICIFMNISPNELYGWK